MRAVPIKNALAYVHYNEKRDGRASAAEYAANLFALTYEERAVLYRALNIA